MVVDRVVSGALTADSMPGATRRDLRGRGVASGKWHEGKRQDLAALQLGTASDGRLTEGSGWYRLCVRRKANPLPGVTLLHAHPSLFVLWPASARARVGRQCQPGRSDIRLGRARRREPGHYPRGGGGVRARGAAPGRGKGKDRCSGASAGAALSAVRRSAHGVFWQRQPLRRANRGGALHRALGLVALPAGAGGPAAGGGGRGACAAGRACAHCGRSHHGRARRHPAAPRCGDRRAGAGRAGAALQRGGGSTAGAEHAHRPSACSLRPVGQPDRAGYGCASGGAGAGDGGRPRGAIGAGAQCAVGPGGQRDCGRARASCRPTAIADLAGVKKPSSGG